MLAAVFLAGCGSKSSKPPTTPPTTLPPATLQPWVHGTGPSVDTVYAITASSFAVIAGTSRGIVRSIDGGTSWTTVDARVVRDLTAGPGTLFAVADAGVLASADGGASWTLTAGVGLPAGAVPVSLTQGSSAQLVVGLESGGAWWSGDGGAHWTLAGLDGAGAVTYLHYDALDSQYYAVANGNLATTSDPTIWPAANSSVGDFLSIVTVGNRIIAGKDGSGIVWTEGTSWTLAADFPAGLKVHALESIATGPTAGLYAATSSGLFRSNDQGSHWARVLTELQSVEFLSIGQANSGLYAGTSGFGAQRSIDGTAWQSVGTAGAQVVALFEYGNFFFAGTADRGLRLSNAGGIWAPTGLDAGQVSSVAYVGDGYMAATPDQGVLFSLFGSIQWLPNNNGLPSNAEATHLAWNGAGTVVSIANDAVSIYRRALGGWNPSTGLPANPIVNALLARGAELFAALGPPAGRPSVYYSDDGGATWSASGIGLPFDTWVNALATAGSALYAGTEGQGVYVSRNGGVSWSFLGLEGQSVRHLAARGSIVAAVLASGEVVRSADGGVTWTVDTVVTDGRSLFAGANAFHAGTTAGVWRAGY